MITKKSKENTAMNPDFPPCVFSSPVIPLTRASIQSRISRQSNLNPSKDQPLDVLIRENGLIRHMHVGSNVQAPTLQIKAERPLEIKKTLSPPKEEKGILKLAGKGLLHLKKNIPPRPPTSIGTNWEKRQDEIIHLSTQKTLKTCKSSEQLNCEQVRSTGGIKNIRHMGILLDSNFKIQKVKLINHMKKITGNMQNSVGLGECPSNLGQERKKKDMCAVNWNGTGKRYSPTAKYLHSKKINFFENAKANGDIEEKKTSKTAEPIIIFSESFRKELEDCNAYEESMLEGKIILPSNRTMEAQEESILDRLQLIEKIREISPIKVPLGIYLLKVNN